MNDKTKYVNLLKAMKKVFDRHKIFFWLDYGTLLGAIRENKIIDWDEDVDIGMDIHDIIKVLDTREDFLNEGYVLKMNKGHGNYLFYDKNTGEHLGCILPTTPIDGYQVRVKYARFIKICILLDNWNTHKKLWRFLFKHKLYKPTTVNSPVDYLGKFKKYKFYGIEFNIPEFPEKYLTYMYGNWKKPDKKGRFNKGTLQEVKNG